MRHKPPSNRRGCFTRHCDAPPAGVGIVAFDDEHEPPKGFLRVERLLLGGDIAAVHICECPRAAAPVRGATVVCATRPPRRCALALA